MNMIVIRAWRSGFRDPLWTHVRFASSHLKRVRALRSVCEHLRQYLFAAYENFKPYKSSVMEQIYITVITGFTARASHDNSAPLHRKSESRKLQ